MLGRPSRKRHCSARRRHAGLFRRHRISRGCARVSALSFETRWQKVRIASTDWFRTTLLQASSNGAAGVRSERFTAWLDHHFRPECSSIQQCEIGGSRSGQDHRACRAAMVAVLRIAISSETRARRACIGVGRVILSGCTRNRLNGGHDDNNRCVPDTCYFVEPDSAAALDARF
jgi:hypothetical protein